MKASGSKILKMAKLPKLLLSSLLGILVICTGGCGVRIDSTSQPALNLSLGEVARYYAASCQESLAAGLANLEAQLPGSLNYQANFNTRLQSFGPRWPQGSSWSQSSSENTENAAHTPQSKTSGIFLPEPDTYQVPDSVEALVSRWNQCAQLQINSAYQLGQLLYHSGEEPDSLIFEGQRDQALSLVRLLLGAGVAQQFELQNYLQSFGQENSAATEIPQIEPLKWNEEKQQWDPRSAARQKLQAQQGEAQLLAGHQQGLNELVKELDALRYQYELSAARLGNRAQKEQVSTQLVPVLRQLCQNLVDQLGSDPRQGSYALSGVAEDFSQASLTLLQSWESLQYQGLEVIPDPASAQLAEILQIIVEAESALGAVISPLPGLSANAASVETAASK